MAVREELRLTVNTEPTKQPQPMETAHTESATKSSSK